MIVLVGIIDAEAKHDFVDKQGFGKIDLQVAEVGARVRTIFCGAAATVTEPAPGRLGGFL